MVPLQLGRNSEEYRYTVQEGENRRESELVENKKDLGVIISKDNEASNAVSRSCKKGQLSDEEHIKNY